MSIALTLLIGTLFGVGTYLLLHRSLTRIILAIGVLGNAVNLMIVTAGGRSGDAPIIGRDGDSADPIPQALVLTGIVIGFALQAFLLALAWRSWTIDGNDEVEDDIDDRRLASGDALAGHDAAAAEDGSDLASGDDDPDGRGP